MNENIWNDFKNCVAVKIVYSNWGYVRWIVEQFPLTNDMHNASGSILNWINFYNAKNNSNEDDKTKHGMPVFSVAKFIKMFCLSIVLIAWCILSINRKSYKQKANLTIVWFVNYWILDWIKSGNQLMQQQKRKIYKRRRRRRNGTRYTSNPSNKKTQKKHTTIIPWKIHVPIHEYRLLQTVFASFPHVGS